MRRRRRQRRRTALIKSNNPHLAGGEKSNKQPGKGQSRQRWRRRVGLQVLFWRFELTVLGWAQAHRAPLIVLSMVSLGCMKQLFPAVELAFDGLTYASQF